MLRLENNIKKSMPREEIEERKIRLFSKVKETTICGSSQKASALRQILVRKDQYLFKV